MPRPLLFCNIGWMRNYQGQTDSDKIVGGGSYVVLRKRGHEVCNFVATNNKVYGYVQPVGKNINLTRLGAKSTATEIRGIDVIITANRPGGDTVVVGWFKNATVYRALQPLINPTSVHKKNDIDSFRYETKAIDAKLIPPEQRTLVVPRGKGGMGQSNVWYAEQAQVSWLAEVRKLIASGNFTPTPRKKRPPPDHFKNALVEKAAMSHVWKHYENRGYTLEDVSKENRGWDLEATSGSLTLCIEVKGLSGKTASVELTPNEYKAFLTNSVTYKLCIVTNCLTQPSLSVCSFNPASEGWAVESKEQYKKVEITERLAAAIAVT